ncbi:YajG family lipoprotein [Campylobacter hominis]|uniref:Lipoprotein n=1 Tax=Campylobacter hominis (strain ATCC BAA-381 / DSM 21671 / CCUG 45161 / LMG 19568 / NCTC 13146 / CH001A) TaxID=360107 RepID=A7I2M7_CAMHC|nr:YajG family lipoprotein [Campylobacter hominis]ABS52472.1 conserved hypothetical protein [Campylobacter hominis ATCC BAA-381]UAK85984.1 hypothetical protein K8O82_00865 [Campylobacter hominis]SUW85287.1 Uncharacterized lipoprotein [Campylobacter hominis]
MKKFTVFLLAAAVTFTLNACSQVSSVLVLNPYTSMSTEKFNANKTVFVASINDKRQNQSIVASVKDSNGDVNEYVTLQGDLDKWFTDALKAELKVRGVAVVENEIDADAKADIDIAKANADIQGYDKDNMKGECEIFITIKKGDTTYTKRVAQSQSEFAAIRTGGAFTPFFENMLRDVVQKTAEQIANTL